MGLEQPLSQRAVRASSRFVREKAPLLQLAWRLLMPSEGVISLMAKAVGIARVENRVAYRLDRADTIVVAWRERNGKVRLQEMPLSETDSIRRVQQIASLGIQTLICGAVSAFISRMFHYHGIRVIGGVIGDAEEVLQQYFRGNLRAGAVLDRTRMTKPRSYCSRKQGCRPQRMRTGCLKKGE